MLAAFDLRAYKKVLGHWTELISATHTSCLPSLMSPAVTQSTVLLLGIVYI